jgi:hypothetical protein
MSCTHAQAPVARKAGEILSIAGVAGLITAGLVAKTTDANVTYVSVTSALVSLAGIGLFMAGDLTGGTQSGVAVSASSEPDAATKHRWAQTWLGRAQEAAQKGDCERVQVIEQRVARLDPELHDVALMRDPQIVKCLHGDESGSDTSGP